MNSEQNTTMARVPDDHPLMVAWNEYKALPDYENTKQWATAPAHTEGSLWAAFMAGWYKARALEQREWFVMVPRDSLECAMQLLYSASNGRENIFANTAHEFRDLLTTPPKPEGSGHG